MKAIKKKLVFKAMAAREAAKERALKLKARLCETNGEGYVDTAVKIIIAVVIGGLLMAGLVLLFNSTIFPSVTEKVNDLFNGGGGGGAFIYLPLLK